MKQRTCDQCGGLIVEETTQGLCPTCLMQAAMGSDVDPRLTPTVSSRGGFVAPGADELTAVFPQLEIRELIGSGGMGAVYRVHQSKLGRDAALKLIRPDVSGDPSFAERFSREARALARLNHPHIVGIYDFGEVRLPSAGDDVVCYFLMEYVDGASLRQVIDSGEANAEWALTIVPQICEALQSAHDEGIVHRDIKPENILLDRRGRVKLADFGLAKLNAEQSDFTLTATNQVLGTVRYMAPEQLSGSSSVDHRADIYSLGVVLYELLTGDLPAGVFEPPSGRGSGDARFDAVVMRALAADPGRRQQTASQVALELSGIRPTGDAVAAHQQTGERPGVSTIIEDRVAAVAAGLKAMVVPRAATESELSEFPDESQMSGHTYITIDRKLIDKDQLPDVCMVCGKPTGHRISREFSHTGDKSGGIIAVLIILFFPLGILAAVMLTRKVRVSCPVCVRHRYHWTKLEWFAGLGWIFIVIGTFGGLWAAGILPRVDNRQPNVIILLSCILPSVAAYVVPLIVLATTRVGVKEINADSVTFSRVSTGFGRAVRMLSSRTGGGILSRMMGGASRNS